MARGGSELSRPFHVTGGVLDSSRIGGKRCIKESYSNEVQTMYTPLVFIHSAVFGYVQALVKVVVACMRRAALPYLNPAKKSKVPMP